MIGSHIIPVFDLQQFATSRLALRSMGWCGYTKKAKSRKREALEFQGKQKGYSAVLQSDKPVDDEATEADITPLENDAMMSCFWRPKRIV
jgi:hypothetical protein